MTAKDIVQIRVKTVDRGLGPPALLRTATGHVVGDDDGERLEVARTAILPSVVIEPVVEHHPAADRPRMRALDIPFVVAGGIGALARVEASRAEVVVVELVPAERCPHSLVLGDG